MAPPNNESDGYSMSNYGENANDRENLCNNDSDSDENKNIFYVDENGNFNRPKIKRKNDLNVADDTKKTEEFKPGLVWKNVILLSLIHIGGFYGVYRGVFCSTVETVIFFWLCIGFILYGVTAGAHRLWSHRSYKAKLPLRILFMISQTMSAQNSIYVWVRDHRVHHKFPDSNADPHNIKRGFFFAHIGWLMVKKHPDVLAKGKTIDMSDLEKDGVVMFQKKYYTILTLAIAFIIPYLIPIYCWGESQRNSFFVIILCRYASSLNATWTINSFSHLLGMKPYDKNISPCNNPYTSFFTGGEGWHNYHHIFPWDYRAAELGNYALNWTIAVIDFFAKIGWAYDLKTVSEEMIRKRVERTGDGSHKWLKLKTPQERLSAFVNDPEFHSTEEAIWGWEDKDMNKNDITDANILHKLM